MSSNFAAPNADEVSVALASRIEELAGTLLPEATRANGALAVGSIRGERGQSLRICLRGSRRGRWKDFADSQGGDALDLVAACLFNRDLKRAYAWALVWLGGAAARPIPTKPPQPETAGSRSDDDEAGLRAAAAIWSGTVAAPGTMTDLYLHDRRIGCAIPPAVRHHPALAYWDAGRCFGKYPALVAAVTDLLTGRLVGAHRVYLDPSIDPGPARKAVIIDGEGRTLPAKKSRGPTKGAAVVLGNLTGAGRVYIGEGIETTMSAVSLTGWPGIATLGSSNMPDVQLPQNLRDIVIVPDPDGPGIRGAIEAARRWAAQGRRVCIAGTVGVSHAA